ncbi:MAG: ATP-binding protein [Deltaproteobacteria bacterium]|nr:ATP-binding protein [Deltaproteobacteria bacterium]
MRRSFNTTGPCDPARHYMLPPVARLPDMAPFIEEQLYFVLHAPRQTGKTTAMRAFAEALRTQGVAACWATVEVAQGIDDTAAAEPLWIEALHHGSTHQLDEAQQAPAPAGFLGAPAGGRLHAYLRAWAAGLSVPLVLLIDEADLISGPAMVSFWRQLRDGFTDRGVGRFPTSVALIGVRALRDYPVQRKDGPVIDPGSMFNFAAASLTLRQYSPAEVAGLLGQHTEETGQAFTPEAVAELARITDGQPFLVNALADLCVTALVPDRAAPVTAAHVDQARARLADARTPHLDSFARRLRAPAAAPVIQATILGDAPLELAGHTDAVAELIDRGLLRRGPDGVEPANPIYAELIVHTLTLNVQANLAPPWWPWTTPSGGLDMPALLEAFRQWWRENADVLDMQVPYTPEAVAHLALCGFLQRVVNGGGRVHREFAAGRGAMDLLISYGPDRFAIELKRVRSRDRLETVVERGAAQLGRYLDTVGLDMGWLVVFDVRPDRSWEERLRSRELEVGGKRVVVLGA